jgi:hypothetical protein
MPQETKADIFPAANFIHSGLGSAGTGSLGVR